MVRSILLVIVTSLAAAGCHSSTDVKKSYGSYDVHVSAFGKTDETMAVIGQGADKHLDFYFVYGFSPTATETSTGIQVKLDGKKLIVEEQPIHVDLATGAEDGTVTGTGELDGTSFTLTFDVVGAENQALAYDLTGTQSSQ